MGINSPSGFEDAAAGCLVGALVGDAAGGTLEFLSHQPTDAEVKYAMTMPGGGAHKLAPGQITDDGELTLCLLWALSESSEFPLEQIALNYSAWMKAYPFDVGNTISRAFRIGFNEDWQTKYNTQSLAEAMTQTALENSLGSKANGSLMRATPLGVWGYQLEDEVLGEYAQQDSLLSHPNESCCQAVACYSIAIASLMKYTGNGELAFEKAYQWAKGHAGQEVINWLDDARANKQQPYHPQTGFVKIAFIHAFRHLLVGTDYESAIQETLLGWGDTDTNACIVGGLIGAAAGYTNIPQDMKEPVLNCDTESGTQNRPKWLRAIVLEELLEKLFQIIAS